MIAISTSEFRKHLRKYLDISKMERVIIQCGKDETFELIPKEKMSETDRYFSNPDVIKGIEEGLADIEAGRVYDVDPKNIWKGIV